MSIAADARYAFKAEVEWLRIETCLCEIRDQEGAEAAVYMERYVFLASETRERRDVINDAMGIVRSGADKEDSVGIDEARD